MRGFLFLSRIRKCEINFINIPHKLFLHKSYLLKSSILWNRIIKRLFHNMNEQVFRNPRRSVQTLGLGIPSQFVKLRVKVQKSVQNWSSFYGSGIEVWPRIMSANRGWGSSSSKKYFIFCAVVLMSDLLVVLDAREAKRNELGSCLEGTKNQVEELDLKLCLFHFNYCHF